MQKHVYTFQIQFTKLNNHKINIGTEIHKIQAIGSFATLLFRNTRHRMCSKLCVLRQTWNIQSDLKVDNCNIIFNIESILKRIFSLPLSKGGQRATRLRPRNRRGTCIPGINRSSLVHTGCVVRHAHAFKIKTFLLCPRYKRVQVPKIRIAKNAMLKDILIELI